MSRDGATPQAGAAEPSEAKPILTVELAAQIQQCTAWMEVPPTLRHQPLALVYRDRQLIVTSLSSASFSPPAIAGPVTPAIPIPNADSAGPTLPEPPADLSHEQKGETLRAIATTSPPPLAAIALPVALLEPPLTTRRTPHGCEVKYRCAAPVPPECLADIDPLGSVHALNQPLTAAARRVHRLACARCAAPLIAFGDAGARVLPLPSDHWQDFVSYWACHTEDFAMLKRLQSHMQMQIACDATPGTELRSDQILRDAATAPPPPASQDGNGGATMWHAYRQQNTVLAGTDRLYVVGSGWSNVSFDTTMPGSKIPVCAQCQATLGGPDGGLRRATESETPSASETAAVTMTSTSTHRLCLYRFAVTIDGEPPAPMASYVARILSDAANAHACYRFVLSAVGGPDAVAARGAVPADVAQPRLFIWLFRPQLLHGHVHAASGPSTATASLAPRCQVLYRRPIREDRDASRVDTIVYPAAVIEAIVAHLRASTQQLPTAASPMPGYEIGIL